MNVSQEIFSRQEKPSIQGQYVCQESENKGRGQCLCSDGGGLNYQYWSCQVLD